MLVVVVVVVIEIEEATYFPVRENPRHDDNLDYDNDYDNDNENGARGSPQWNCLIYQRTVPEPRRHTHQPQATKRGVVRAVDSRIAARLPSVKYGSPVRLCRGAAAAQAPAPST